MKELKKHISSNAWSIGLVIIFLFGLQMFYGSLLPKMGFWLFIGKCFIYALIVLAADIAYYITYNLIHFVGILLGGVMTGYKLLSIRFLNMDLTRHEGKLSFSFKNSNNVIVLGLPLKDYKGNTPYFWVNSTSLFLRVAITIVAIFQIFSSPFNFSDYLALFVKCGLILFSYGVIIDVFRNLFSVFSERYRKLATIGNILTALLLSREPEQRKIYTHIFQTNTLLYQGKMLNEMPDELFEDLPLDDNYTFYNIMNRVQYLYRFIGSGQYELAQQAIEADKISFVKTYNYTIHYIHCRLNVEFYTHRRPERLQPFCKKIIMLALQNSKRFGLLYAFNKVCMLDDYEAQKAKSSYESYNYSTPQDEIIEASMISFIDALNEEGGLPTTPMANIPDSPVITYNPKRMIYSLILAPMIAFMIHTSFLENKPREENTDALIEQEYANVVKHEMIKALDINDCEQIITALQHDADFREAYPNSKYIDYDYIALAELCREHLYELDCSNSELNDN